jgi:hypothetical protein
MAEPFDDPFDDQPLVRSLRGPGTPGELAEQDHYLAMFRETRGETKVTPLAPGAPRRPGGRAARRLGAGTTLTIALAVAGGGVAAAYTGSLPEPLQNFAHSVLGPVKVPAATPRPPDRVDAVPEPAPSPSAEETPSATPSEAEPTASAEPSGPGGDNATPSGQAEPSDVPTDSPSATATPTPGPSSDPTSTPTPAPTPAPSPTVVIEPPVPASVSISGSTHRVEYAASPVFSGHVRAEDGAGVAGVQVGLMQRQDGVWRRVAFATTDETGGVQMSAPPVYGSTSLRFKTKGARSHPWRVTMHPELTLSTSVEGDTVTIVASAAGGRQGDVVRLGGRRGGQNVTLATGILGPGGSVTFQVQQDTRKARYGALLEATSVHTADKAVAQVVKPKAPKGGDGTAPAPPPEG